MSNVYSSERTKTKRVTGTQYILIQFSWDYGTTSLAHFKVYSMVKSLVPLRERQGEKER